MTMQDRNNHELGASEAKVYVARERSPGKKYNASSPLRASGNQNASTAAYTNTYAARQTYGQTAERSMPAQQHSRSPPRNNTSSYGRRGNSPLRSSYKATYNY